MTAIEAARAHLRSADPVLARLLDERPEFDPGAPLAELPEMDVFGGLVFQVVGQQISVRAAAAIVDRLSALFAGRLPEPAELLAADPESLRRAGVSERKQQTLRALAERFVSGELSEERLRAMSDEEVEAKLIAVPGVGAWTVRGVLILVLDRPDVVLAGDLAIRRAVRDLYELDHLPAQAEVVQMAERWRPYRSLAMHLLIASDSGR